MRAARAKVLDYELELDREGRISASGSTPHAVPAELTPEHLVLAGLCRCTLTSLEYHARRTAVDLVASTASASGRVTRREQDGRYAFVEIECRLDVELDPAPESAALADLLTKTERDCFVGASLTVTPRYAWGVNGVSIP